MRYEMIRLAQFVFFLTMMFGALLAGLAIGWFRWGRRPERSEPDELHRSVRPRPATPHTVKSDLFAPESDAEVVDLAMFAPAAELAPVRPVDGSDV